MYIYNPIEHGLSRINDEISHSKIKSMILGQPFSENSSVNFCFVSRFNRLWAKYSDSRSYSVAYLDVGHLSENMFLYAHQLKQNEFITGSFVDDEFKEILCLDENSSMIFFMAVGEGKHECFPMQYFSKNNIRS